MILNNVSAEYALAQMIPVICDKLDELKHADPNDKFADGLRTAYVECLEYIQMWQKSKLYGLDFNIESMYPLIHDFVFKT